MISEELHKLFIERKTTLSIAESCTGGALSAAITSQAGASGYFLGGIVAYSNELKKNLLKVKDETITSHGAVSRETVVEMAQGIQELTRSDIAIAVSGIAGPTGGTNEKPVGTIWAAIAQKGKATVVWTFRAEGNRQEVIASTVRTILEKVFTIIKKDSRDKGQGQQGP